jgi:hypothetical protein
VEPPARTRNDRADTMPDGKRHDQAEKLIVNRRRSIAANMRRAGATWQQIADTATWPDGTPCYPAGSSRTLVYVDIKRGLEEATRELSLDLAELREQESQRLDDYLLRLRPAITAGDPKAIGTAVRITEVRARLYGMNEPERHEVITVDALDAAARELEQQIARRAAIDAGQGQPST